MPKNSALINDVANGLKNTAEDIAEMQRWRSEVEGLMDLLENKLYGLSNQINNAIFRLEQEAQE